jgi:hypothetical protein
LVFTELRDDEVHGLYLHWFIKRANLFAHLVGRGHAALKAASETGARAILAFAVQQFACYAIK